MSMYLIPPYFRSSVASKILFPCGPNFFFSHRSCTFCWRGKDTSSARATRRELRFVGVNGREESGAPADLPLIGGRGDEQRQGHATLSAIQAGGADAKNQGRRTNLLLEGGGREGRWTNLSLGGGGREQRQGHATSAEIWGGGADAKNQGRTQRIRNQGRRRTYSSLEGEVTSSARATRQ